MPRDIFGEIARPSVKLGSRAWYTLPLSILTHAAVAAAIIALPLMAPDLLPQPPAEMVLIAAPPIPEPPPAPRMAAAAPAAAAASRSAAPSRVPDEIVAEMPAAVPDTGAGVVGGVPFDGVIGGVVSDLPLPPAPAVAAPGPPAPVRPGGHIKQPVKVRDVRPVYPQIAVVSKVEGRVIIEAIIGVDGRVTSARVLKSVMLLDQAALDAVQQWRFTPTLLNGVPVPVIISVTVDFKLQ